MTTFKDSTGRAWTVSLNLGAVRDMRAAGFEVGKGGDKAGEIMFADPEVVAKVLWLLVAGQHPDVTAEQFEAALDGPALEQGGLAVLAAAVAFFHRGPRGELMKARLPGLLEKWNRDAGVAIAAKLDAYMNDTEPAGN